MSESVVRWVKSSFRGIVPESGSCYTGDRPGSLFGGFRMSEAVKTEHPHIVRLAGVCGGEPVIDGLRVAVQHVVTLHQAGETIPEIAEALGITEAQIFHALSYFSDHRDEILALIAQEQQAHVGRA